MDLYAFFKFLHVMAALAWVGGGMVLLVNAILLQRDQGDLAAIRVNGGLMATLGPRFFVPASLLTLVTGATTTTISGLWGELWIIIALAGAATTFALGLLVVEPMGRAMGKLMAEGREAEAIALGRRLQGIAKFDYSLMVVIVADMVLKPYWGDLLVLGAMAALLVAGAVLFLLPQMLDSKPSAA